MAKGKGTKGKGAMGTKVTLRMAKKALRVTSEGRHRLDLSNMGITHFPKCLLKLANVDELDLSRNMIQKLPDDIGNFFWLSRLDLHSNQLDAVPESIGRLAALTHLNLSNNRLTSRGLPSTLGSLSRLRTLNLGLNRLDALPHTMVALTGLQELGLFDNLLTELPECVKVLGSLTKLNTARNPLSCNQGDGGGVPEEVMYLVSESSLCKTCLKKCKEERERQMRRGGGEGGRSFEENKKRPYSGLITPNSVAILNQDAWRRGGLTNHIPKQLPY